MSTETASATSAKPSAASALKPGPGFNAEDAKVRAEERREDPVSRLVRAFKADSLVRCGKCGSLPVEATLTYPNGATKHRFECPSCDGQTGTWISSHSLAEAVWNAKQKTP